MTEQTVRPIVEDRVGVGLLAPGAPGARRALLVIGVLLLLGLAVVQPRLAPDLAIALLYLVPVVTLAWVGGRSWGTAAAIGAGGVRFIVDLAQHRLYTSPEVPYWNLGMSVAIYLIIAELLPRLRTALDAERERARTDPLTGLGNRRFFDDVARVELNRTRRYSRPLALGFVDVDYFKEVNDRLGHEAGDQLLRLISKEIVHVLRTSDIIARIGGDEFAVLLPETPAEGADVAFHKMHEHLTAAVQREGFPVSFSVGVVTYQGGDVSLEALLREADQTMYVVKNSGKGFVRTEGHQAEPAVAGDPS